ncbi:unnamed protein product [Meloidogyne enterolobii]|uniref:Uncharacterized protein n=1 Tax=Meloidogyne enterolobii TaxID=390850 RepID=A0ACB0ZXI8_MELEN
MLFSSLLSPAIIIYAQFQIVYSVQETRQIICVASECSWSWAADLTYFLFTSFYGFTLINYSTVWIVLKYRTWKANNNLGKYRIYFINYPG